MTMNIFTKVPTNFGYFSERFLDLWKKQVDQARSEFGSVIQEVLMPEEHPTDVPIFFVERSQWVSVARFFKEASNFKYNFLADLTATDEMPDTPRFHLVLNLFSHESLSRVRLKTKVEEGQGAPSLIPVWEGANWAEREVFDMFGIQFSGHPDLRRILLDVRWQGHPLRKDYPLKGYQLFQTPEPIDTKLLGD
jgi:NADH-quinone oxidoreductase subunit C